MFKHVFANQVCHFLFVFLFCFNVCSLGLNVVLLVCVFDVFP